MPPLHTTPPRCTLSEFGYILMGIVSVIAMGLMMIWMAKDGVTDLLRDAEGIAPDKGYITDLPVVTEAVIYTLPATTYGPADLFLADGGQLTITVVANEHGERTATIAPSAGLAIYGVQVGDQFYPQSRQKAGEPVVLTSAHGRLDPGEDILIYAALQ